ncbi:MAG: hypothetical protein II942_03635 [Alphaproteobacteria bacterium]|nr:hypothetical protein [Alphaproteobacteria bacterium]
MRTIVFIVALLLASPSWSFGGGHSHGRVQNYYQGVNSIGVYYGGDSQADVDFRTCENENETWIAGQCCPNDRVVDENTCADHTIPDDPTDLCKNFRPFTCNSTCDSQTGLPIPDDEGTPCGTGKVCDNSGDCVCDTDLIEEDDGCYANACEGFVADTCTTACQSVHGQASYTYAEGTSCGTGKVCDNAGSCVCDTDLTEEDDGCYANACEGFVADTCTTACASTHGVASYTYAEGTTCGTGKVCSSGNCVCDTDLTEEDDGCYANACDGFVADTCTTACNSVHGQAVYTYAEGTSCGTGKVCDNSGSCVCDTDLTEEDDGCYTNACDGFVADTCTTACNSVHGQAVYTYAEGTPCGTGKVCNNAGSCVCDTGLAEEDDGNCYTNACEGFVADTCTTACQSVHGQASYTYAEGTTCGTGKVCDNSGSCVCDEGYTEINSECMVQDPDCPTGLAKNTDGSCTVCMDPNKMYLEYKGGCTNVDTTNLYCLSNADCASDRYCQIVLFENYIPSMSTCQKLNTPVATEIDVMDPTGVGIRHMIHSASSINNGISAQNWCLAHGGRMASLTDFGINACDSTGKALDMCGSTSVGVITGGNWTPWSSYYNTMISNEVKVNWEHIANTWVWMNESFSDVAMYAFIPLTASVYGLDFHSGFYDSYALCVMPLSCGEHEVEQGDLCLCDTANGYYGIPGSCVKCDGTGEIYDNENNECVCDAANHWTGTAGSCACDTGRTEENGVCVCNEGYVDENGQCLASCDGLTPPICQKCIIEDNEPVFIPDDTMNGQSCGLNQLCSNGVCNYDCSLVVQTATTAEECALCVGATFYNGTCYGPCGNGWRADDGNCYSCTKTDAKSPLDDNQCGRCSGFRFTAKNNSNTGPKCYYCGTSSTSISMGDYGIPASCDACPNREYNSTKNQCVCKEDHTYTENGSKKCCDIGKKANQDRTGCENENLCSDGFFFSYDQDACVPCGTNAQLTNSVECASCPNMSFANNGRCYNDAPPGHILDNNGNIYSCDSLIVGIGFIDKGNGADPCGNCDNRFYSSKTNKCVRCDYGDDMASTEEYCNKCPLRTYNNGTCSCTNGHLWQWRTIPVYNSSSAQYEGVENKKMPVCSCGSNDLYSHWGTCTACPENATCNGVTVSCVNGYQKDSDFTCVPEGSQTQCAEHEISRDGFCVCDGSQGWYGTSGSCIYCKGSGVENVNGVCTCTDAAKMYLEYGNGCTAVDTTNVQCRSNADCASGEYCKITGYTNYIPSASSCVTLDDPVVDMQVLDVSGTESKRMIRSASGRTWDAAQNWCLAQGGRMASLTDFGITDCSPTVQSLENCRREANSSVTTGQAIGRNSNYGWRDWLNSDETGYYTTSVPQTVKTNWKNICDSTNAVFVKEFYATNKPYYFHPNSGGVGHSNSLVSNLALCVME